MELTKFRTLSFLTSKTCRFQMWNKRMKRTLPIFTMTNASIRWKLQMFLMPSQSLSTLLLAPKSRCHKSIHFNTMAILRDLMQVKQTNKSRSMMLAMSTFKGQCLMTKRKTIVKKAMSLKFTGNKGHQSLLNLQCKRLRKENVPLNTSTTCQSNKVLRMTKPISRRPRLSKMRLSVPTLPTLLSLSSQKACKMAQKFWPPTWPRTRKNGCSSLKKLWKMKTT